MAEKKTETMEKGIICFALKLDELSDSLNQLHLSNADLLWLRRIVDEMKKYDGVSWTHTI